MNSKTLKNLRSFIRRTFGHLPARGLDAAPQNYRLIPGPMNLDGTPGKPFRVAIAGTVRNTPLTQRGAYRAAKREPALR